MKKLIAIALAATIIPSAANAWTKEEKREILEIMELCSRALGMMWPEVQPVAQACRSKTSVWAEVNEISLEFPVYFVGLDVDNYALAQRVDYRRGMDIRDSAMKRIKMVRDALRN